MWGRCPLEVPRGMMLKGTGHGEAAAEAAAVVVVVAVAVAHVDVDVDVGVGGDVDVVVEFVEFVEFAGPSPVLAVEDVVRKPAGAGAVAVGSAGEAVRADDHVAPLAEPERVGAV